MGLRGSLYVNRKYLYSILILIALAIGEFEGMFSLLKYGKYFTFIIALLICLESEFKVGARKLYSQDFLVPFVFLLLFYLLNVVRSNKFMIIDFIIITGAILPFIFRKSIAINVKFINCLLFGAFFLANGLSFKVSLSQEALMASNVSTAESGIFPFLFGLFAIFFFQKKKYLYVAANILFLVFSLKRIVLFGVIIVIIVLVFKLNKKKGFARLLILGNFTWLFVSYFICTDFFYDLCINTFGLPPAAITLGRSTRFEIVWDYYFHHSLVGFLFGIGPGMGRILIQNAYDGIPLQLHNDILKVFFDFGIVVFSAFIFMLYRVKPVLIPLVLFMNFLFLTDNTLIYEPVLFLYFLLQQQLKHNNIE